jgi:SAM-dependent methyltransferase
LFGVVNLAGADQILEVGCGTGVILTELVMQSHGTIFGLDISPEHLDFAAHNLPGIPLTLGDAHHLPYPSQTFDVTVCHFLLLWVDNPGQVVSELARTVKPGGWVLALAEPDYGGRIDYPPELGILGDLQQAALRQQGADPLIGRKLRAIFEGARLTNMVTGILGGEWSGRPEPEEMDMEWAVMEDDIQSNAQNDPSLDISKLRFLDQGSWEKGERILYVPTFYAFGQVA